MVAEFDRLAWQNYQELALGQSVGPGKAIVFAITKHHAARLAQYLNELHPEHRGHYAEVITSDVTDADALIRRFKYEDYPQVAVSVGMLDTGFDCREVLHLVLCRRVRSPILYQQMRGRGTRTAPHIGKRMFVIYDFFGNHDYFNDSDTDIFTSTGGGHVTTRPTTPPKSQRELIELGLEDEWLQAVAYVEVGLAGERVDKQEYITNWERTIRTAVDDDDILRKIRAGEALTPEEEQRLAARLNAPRYYFNEDNLRRAYRQPGGTLIDFIRAALGSFKLKSHEEELTENFQAWLVSKHLNPEQAQYLGLLKNRGIVRGKIEVADLFQPPLSVLNAAGLGVELFGERGLGDIINDLNTSVFQPNTA
jgi:type I restriction enzyme R subunit